jgi:hypothetical protein
MYNIGQVNKIMVIDYGWRVGGRMNDLKIILDIREILNTLGIEIERLNESKVLNSSLNPESKFVPPSSASPVFDHPITSKRARQTRKKQDSVQSL